ncbi:complement C1q tumor necrosis factor-related protein 3-like [Mytilus edulis]|uniref:complement C1q tumor necrosis factor-related protein 3-like n=1 Tax=Mytilus edulis TaxID=6550 RepID=UPI0039F14673
MISVQIFLLIFVAVVNANVCEEQKTTSCCESKDTIKDEFVAFTAITTNGNALTNNPIKYDIIVTNVGKAYSSTSGIFHAPITGIYSISFSIMGQPNNSIYGNLYHNGMQIIRIYTKGDNRHEVASQTVYLKLVKRDEVWIQGTAGMKLWTSERYNQFSGALVRSGDFAN